MLSFISPVPFVSPSPKPRPFVPDPMKLEVAVSTWPLPTSPSPLGPCSASITQGTRRLFRPFMGAETPRLQDFNFKQPEFKATVQMTMSLCFFTLRNQADTQERDTQTLLMDGMLSASPAAVAGKGGKSCFSPVLPARQLAGAGPGPNASAAASTCGCRGPLQSHGGFLCGCDAYAPSSPYLLRRWPLSIMPVSHGR